MASWFCKRKLWPSVTRRQILGCDISFTYLTQFSNSSQIITKAPITRHSTRGFQIAKKCKLFKFSPKLPSFCDSSIFIAIWIMVSKFEVVLLPAFLTNCFLTSPLICCYFEELFCMKRKWQANTTTKIPQHRKREREAEWSRRKKPEGSRKNDWRCLLMVVASMS